MHVKQCLVSSVLYKPRQKEKYEMWNYFEVLFFFLYCKYMYFRCLHILGQFYF